MSQFQGQNNMIEKSSSPKMKILSSPEKFGPDACPSRQGKPVEICLLGASAVADNRGVAALATGAITAALKAYPGGRVFLLDYSRVSGLQGIRIPGGEAEVELVSLRFSKKVFLRNNIARLLLGACWYRILPSQRLKDNFAARNPVLARLLEADLIGSIAGGDSFSDIYGLQRLVYVSLPQLLVLLLGRPLITLPQTLGPFKGLIARQMARQILRRSAVIYSRDLESIEEMRSLLGDTVGRIRTCCDLAFVMEPFPPNGARMDRLRVLKSTRPLVGLNVSGLLYIGGYSQDNMFGLNSDYRDMIRSIVRYFIKQGADVLLVPHVFGQGGESDPAACGAIHRELGVECAGHLNLLEGEYDAQEIKYVIGRCDFFLGARMHACIAALSQCVPAIGLAYSRKFRGVFQSIRVEEYAIDLHELDTITVLQRIESAYRTREKIRHHLERVVPEAKQSVHDMFVKFPSESQTARRT